MLGLWTSIEATGTWPVGVNIWQYGTWADVESQLARQFEPRAQDPGLKEWWLRNLDLRTGGFDRLIESTDYTRDVGALRRAGIAGALFLHEIVRLADGARERFLEAFGREGAPAAESAGARLVGAYRVLLQDAEAVILYAFPAANDLAGFQRRWYDPASALGRWREREMEWVEEREALILKPRYFLSSPWHP